MRIAFFTDSYLPNHDGVVSIILGYKKELEKKGHEVHVFTPGTREQRETSKEPRVYYFTSASFKPYPDYRLSLFPFLSATRRTKEISPDIIHSHGIATTGLAAIQCSRKYNIPCVASFHTMVSEATHYIAREGVLRNFLSKVAWEYLTRYYGFFKRVICPSEFTRTILEKRGIKNVVILPNGVNTEKFNEHIDRERVKKEYGINKKVVLYV